MFFPFLFSYSLLPSTSFLVLFPIIYFLPFVSSFFYHFPLFFPLFSSMVHFHLYILFYNFQFLTLSSAAGCHFPFVMTSCSHFLSSIYSILFPYGPDGTFYSLCTDLSFPWDSCNHFSFLICARKRTPEPDGMDKWLRSFHVGYSH